MKFFHLIQRRLFTLITFGFVPILINYFRMKAHNIRYESFPRVNGKLILKCNGKLSFGHNVTINSSSKHNIIGGDVRTIILINKDGVLTIGNNVGISNSSFICRHNITIEDNVLIGGSCKFYDTDFHSISSQYRIEAFKNREFDSNAKVAPIVLKNGCWIGAHSIVLKGVTIGENSIIGAGSVVAKNIPANQIWAGNPARFIREI